MYSTTKRILRAVLLTTTVCAAAGALMTTSASARHVKRHWSGTETYYHYMPASDASRFPRTIDDFNVNGG
jgi:hypothetical protein